MGAYTFWEKVQKGKPVRCPSGRTAIVISTHRSFDYVKDDAFREEGSPLVLASTPKHNYMAVLDLPQGTPPFFSETTTIPVADLIPYN